MAYWKETYGQKSEEFIKGVIAGIIAHAVWKDGKQIVGVLEQPLDEAIAEIRVQLKQLEGG